MYEERGDIESEDGVCWRGSIPNGGESEGSEMKEKRRSQDE